MTSQLFLQLCDHDGIVCKGLLHCQQPHLRDFKRILPKWKRFPIVPLEIKAKFSISGRDILDHFCKKSFISLQCILHKCSSIVKYYYDSKYTFYFYYILSVIHSCESKAEFSVSLLQFSVSQDSSEMTLIC